MKESKPYPRIDEEDGNMLTASEPVAATAMVTEYALPEDVDYANIVDGTLQVTSDIEEELAGWSVEKSFLWASLKQCLRNGSTNRI